jgi:hypothetical protein
MKKPMLILLALLLVGTVAYFWHKRRKANTTTTAIKQPTDVFGDNLNTGMVNVVGKTNVTEQVATNRWNLV